MSGVLTEIAILRVISVLLEASVLAVGYRRKLWQQAPMFYAFIAVQFLQGVLMGVYKYGTMAYENAWMYWLFFTVLYQLFCTTETMDFTVYHFPGAGKTLRFVTRAIYTVSLGIAIWFATHIMPTLPANLARTTDLGMTAWRVVNVTTVVAFGFVELSLWLFPHILMRTISREVTLHRRLLMAYFSIPIALSFLVWPHVIDSDSAVGLLMILQGLVAFCWIGLGMTTRGLPDWVKQPERTQNNERALSF